MTVNQEESEAINQEESEAIKARVVSVTTTATTGQQWLLSIPEACKALGVGRSTLYELVGKGDVEVVRIGRRALVPVAAVEAYVQSLRPRGGAPAA